MSETLIAMIISAINDKDRDANQLDQWANESERGGWSTHQVEPMRKLADRLRREASQMRRDVNREHKASQR